MIVSYKIYVIYSLWMSFRIDFSLKCIKKITCSVTYVFFLFSKRSFSHLKAYLMKNVLAKQTMLIVIQIEFTHCSRSSALGGDYLHKIIIFVQFPA